MSRLDFVIAPYGCTLEADTDKGYYIVAQFGYEHMALVNGQTLGTGTLEECLELCNRYENDQK